jgi:HSP20 family protein
MRYAPDVDDLFSSLRARLYRLLDEFAAPVAEAPEEAWLPPTDVAIRDDTVIITVEVPGARREDLEVEVSNHVITISGWRGRQMEPGDNLLRGGRPLGRFRRSFSLPWPLDAEAAVARLRRGVLTVQVPRAKRQQIQVEE